MRIRPATPADRARLVEMAVRFINESGYRALLTPSEPHIGRLVDILLEGNVADGVRSVFVAEGQSGPMGMIGLAGSPHPMSGELTAGELAWWLEPEARGGITAARMLHVAETWAAEQGARSIDMIAPVGTKVGALYERRGYVAMETMYRKALR